MRSIYYNLQFKMQLQKNKKQRQQKSFRLNLKTLFSLAHFQQIPPLIIKSYPRIQRLYMIRLAACIQINYLINCYVQILNKRQEEKKQEKQGVQGVKIGLIGCGIVGHLILHNIMVFIKQGLNPKNIYVSTRDWEKLKHLKNHFGINIEFNNQRVAQIADILILATPATLDNWIIIDLIPILSKRMQSKQTKPLTYLLTSNFHEEKVKKLFTFPVFLPSIRAENIEMIEAMFQSLNQIKGTAEQSEIIIKSRVQKAQQILSENINIKKVEELFQFITTISKDNISKVGDSIDVNSNKDTISLASKSSNVIKMQPNKQQENKNIIQNVLYAQNTFQATFITKSRKWRMAYNNYIG